MKNRLQLRLIDYITVIEVVLQDFTVLGGDPFRIQRIKTTTKIIAVTELVDPIFYTDKIKNSRAN